MQSGYSHLSYNVNGHLAEARDEVGQRSLRYVNNAQGLVLKREEIAKGSTYKRQDYYYLDGKQIDSVGNDGTSRVDYAQALVQSQIGNRKDQYREGQPVNSADFDQSYEPIGPSYPDQTPGFVTVKAGDTLQSLAALLWADQAMWYLLADANSLSGSEPLAAGQVLKVPNKVTNVHNNSGTYRVYSPGEAIGDVTPTLPDPPPPPQQDGGGCGGVGAIFVAVVAVVAVVMTAGALAPILAPGLAAAGSGLMASGLAVLGSAGASLGALAAAGIAGAVGSIVSQGVAMAMGMQDRFSWGQVGLSAFSTAATAGLAGASNTSSLSAFAGKGLGEMVARTMAVNAMTQGVAMATGLQKSFNWTSVAASGAAAGASGWMAEGLGWSSKDPVANVGYGTLRGLVSGGIQSQLTGQRPNWSAIAAESFGSALGDQVVSGIQNQDRARQQQKAAFAKQVRDWGFSGRAEALEPAWLSLDSLSNEAAYAVVDDEPMAQRATAAKAQAPSKSRQRLPAGKDEMVISIVGGGNYPGEAEYDPSRVQASRTELQGMFSPKEFSWNYLLGQMHGVAKFALNSVDGLARTAADSLYQLGDIVSLGMGHDSSIAQGVWARQNVRGQAVTSLLSDPVASALGFVDSLNNRRQQADVLENMGRDFEAGSMRAQLGLDVGTMFFGGSVRKVLGAEGLSLPSTIASSDLGVLLGRGGNKDVFAYRESQAVGVLRSGKNPQVLVEELRLLTQLDELGLPTVNARGPINVAGQPGLVFDRFAQGSKEIVRLENGKIRIVGESPLLNAQSVVDLQGIRSAMETKKIQINDLQFLISERGRVVIADPLAVNVNAAPSKNNLRMIDLLIQSAKRNGPFK